MDRIEAKDYLQAAALGCLDSDEFNELKELLEFDSELQFELASYQTLCALIPFSLDIINPGDIVKDNVALRLKRIEEELRAKRAAEMKTQTSEVKIEDTSEINEEIKPVETQIANLSDEISTEPVIETPAEEVEIETPEIVEAPVPESYLAEDLTKIEDIPDIPVEEEIISEEIFEVDIEEPQIQELKKEIIQEEEVTLSEEEVIERTPTQFEDVKYDEPNQIDTKPVTESFTGQVKIDHPYSESKFADITSRTVAERLQKSFQLDIEAIKHTVERSESNFFKGLITLVIICAILLAISIFIFFKFTADIKKLEQELEKVKRSDSVGSIYKPTKVIPDYYKVSAIHPFRR
ncbi:hypothetical protein [Ignavibacterium sp.]|jgi:hypothetical protein|uniref:hypothetical protein n=1 Tax=Ignavibacterium sp. TaxID=2651167 RepID=UPI0025BEE00A|nr:hypothetical protein [Ignavibacterium sp.]